MLSTDQTLWDHWRRIADSGPDREAIAHWVTGEEPYRWTRGRLIHRAEWYAVRLAEAGVGPGDVCALIVRHHPEFYPLYMGIEALGALPAVLAYPNARLHPDKFRHGLAGMAVRSGLDWVLTERELESKVRPLISGGGGSIRDVLFPLEWGAEAESPQAAIPAWKGRAQSPDDPCLLQHSSGTTGLQKGIVLSHRAVLEHVVRYGGAVGLAAADRVVSWLPLYHDMGLIAAFHLPLAFGIPTVQLDPFEWVMAPVILLEALSRERGTLTWLPNFGYNFMADSIRQEDLVGVDLAPLRLVVNCSEPVRQYSHDRFIERFRQCGLREASLAACYAMAETTFAVTQTRPAERARSVDASREALARGSYVPAQPGESRRQCVSSGEPIPGCFVRVVADTGEEAADGEVGEVAISSVSMFTGYRNNPEETARVLRDGWYFSGDYGFRWEGELYVIGRKKDLIIVAGKNIYPEDVEDAVGGVAGVLPGRVVAFGLEDERAGTEQICVVAETAVEDEAGRKTLARAIIAAGMLIDVTVARVYLVSPRWLIKSSAGKPSRSANRERALQDMKPVA